MGEGPSGHTTRLALRCYPVLPDAKPRSGPRRRRWPPKSVLVFDTETTTDARQQLTFGSYRGYLLAPDSDGSPRYKLAEEVLFYADNAPADAIKRLKDYARSHRSAVPGRRRVPVISQRIATTLLHAVKRARALVCALGFPFDCSRLAFKAGAARGERARGGSPSCSAL